MRLHIERMGGLKEDYSNRVAYAKSGARTVIVQIFACPPEASSMGLPGVPADPQQTLKNLLHTPLATPFPQILVQCL